MKTPLVIVSGLLSNQSLWKHQTRNLSDLADIHIISPSQNAPDKMIQCILDEAPPIFALAGHSMGGWLCLEVMRAAPSRVNRLCLLNTTARMDSEAKREIRKELIHRAENGYFPEIVEEIVEKFVANQMIRNDIKKMFLEVGKEAFIHQQTAMAGRRESQSILPTISCPTLVIHARKDKNFSLEEHQELTHGIKHAKLAVIEDSGHMSPMEMPQAVTVLLRFWLNYFTERPK